MKNDSIIMDEGDVIRHQKQHIKKLEEKVKTLEQRVRDLEDINHQDGNWEKRRRWEEEADVDL